MGYGILWNLARQKLQPWTNQFFDKIETPAWQGCGGGSWRLRLLCAVQKRLGLNLHKATGPRTGTRSGHWTRFWSSPTARRMVMSGWWLLCPTSCSRWKGRLAHLRCRVQPKAKNPLRGSGRLILKYLRSEGRLDLEGMSMATGITKEDLLRAWCLMGLIKKNCGHEGFFKSPDMK